MPQPTGPVEVRGPFRGISGYDHHVRELVRGLHVRGVAIRLVDTGLWGSDPLPTEKADPWFESLRTEGDPSVILHFAVPHRAEPARGKANVLFTMFEGTRIPRAWTEMSRAHDLVVVPSESSRRAWVAGGFPPARVRICPLGVDAALYESRADPLPLVCGQGSPVAASRTRFLNVSEFGVRKNLTALLRVWLSATSAADDAVLVLKLSARDSELERFRLELACLEEEAGRTLDEAAPFRLVRERYSDYEMRRLYAAATHYVTLSHGEGWDLAATEAGASGLAVIAPRHSAYLEYLDDETAYLVDSRLVPASLADGDPLRPLFRDADWWEPDEAQAGEILRAVIHGRSRAKTSPRQRILRDFSWGSAAERLRQVLAEAEALAGRRPLRPRRWYASALPAPRRRR